MSEADQPDDVHLNSNRIRQMATLRRAAIRTRSYCFVALAACVVAAAQCVFLAIRRWPSPLSFREILEPALLMIGTIGLLALGGYFLRLAVRFHQEVKRSAIQPPDAPPDFSNLQDGSQFSRNLEDM